MIKNSFIFLEGVGQKLERKFWEDGVSDWDSFMSRKQISRLSNSRKGYYDRRLSDAKKALYQFDSSYFKNVLPSCENWRLYDFFKEDCVFLDIETTGFSSQYDDITVFGLYDGYDSKIMIKGINLDYHVLKQELSKYKLIVTFNGASFDVPFINKRYPGILPNVPNFDVKSISGRLGLKGGLKLIEKQLGIARKEIVEDFDGGDALTLWRMYKATGDEYYLKLLVEYNEFDILNLKIVAEKCIKSMKESIFKSLISN